MTERISAEAAVAEAAKKYSNWGRWGEDDVLGTVNFIDGAKRRQAASLVRKGVSISLAMRFQADGPQRGWRKRNNPVHVMLGTGLDVVHGDRDMPHGIGGADDMIIMPLQCATQWDGLGHIFDHGVAYNGRPADKVVTTDGDKVTGIENLASPVASRGVLLDVGRVFGENGELPDGFAITEEHLQATAEAHGVEIGRGDIVCVRTGQLTRAKREGWGEYAGGPAPGLSFWTAGWLHRTEIAAIATDTWGFEVRPNEFENAFQPLHQVVIPHMGLLVGEMWDLDALADDCAADGVYEFFLVAPPLPITGAVGSPINPLAIK